MPQHSGWACVCAQPSKLRLNGRQVRMKYAGTGKVENASASLYQSTSSQLQQLSCWHLCKLQIHTSCNVGHIKQIAKPVSNLFFSAKERFAYFFFHLGLLVRASDIRKITFSFVGSSLNACGTLKIFDKQVLLTDSYACFRTELWFV